MTMAVNKILFNQNKKIIKAKLPEESICPYCNCLMQKNSNCPYSLVSIDHIQPYTKGGSDALENLIACCANCNTRKGNSRYMGMFKLTHPQKLKEQEFMLLNDYVDIKVRLHILSLITEYLKKEDFNSAFALCKKSILNTTSKKFFSKLALTLKEKYHQNDSLKNRSHKALVEVVVRIKAEKDKMLSLEDKTAHLEFTTYTLVS